AIPEVIEKLRDVLGHQDPAVALFELAGRIGAPRSLREIGMPEHSVDVATERALANPYWNPQPLERDGIRALLARAYAGEAPAI
ncbi:maleylacetate reductase, partial [Rhizobium ruizarguesonis]